MKYKVITSDSNKTHFWGGGSTTELFIYPQNSNFKEKDFDFRLSTATVEIEKSNFTALPEISRTLMVLDGQMTLNHKYQHSKALSKFDTDKFDGGWTTTSVGMCIDFNLMTKGNTTGKLEAHTIEKTLEYKNDNSCSILCFYIYKGEIEINKKTKLNQGDVLVLSEYNNDTIEIEALMKSELIVITIKED